MQKNVIYKEKRGKKGEKGEKYHKPQIFNVPGKSFFPLMLQMFYSVEVTPSSNNVMYDKAPSFISVFKRISLFLFSFFRNHAFTYYLCSTDYWSAGWGNAISLFLEMNQFEMPELFRKLLLEMPVVLKMSLVSTCSIYLRKQRWHCVWQKKEVCTTTIK